MAKKRSKPSAEQYVEGMVELIAALSNIRNGGNGHRETLTDPSVNVKERVELQAAFDKERRDSDRMWQERLDKERQRADEASRAAEVGRVDAKFADVVQNALLVQQTTANAAQTLATTLANSTETLRKSQETTDLATRAAIRAVEQNQATGGGEKTARTEQRSQSNFNLSQWISVLGIAVILLIDLRSRGII